MIKNILLLFSITYLASCANWQNQKVTSDAPENHNIYVTSMPAEERWKDKLITDFYKQSYNWKISHPDNMSASLKDSSWAIYMNNVGPNYEEITMNFLPTSFANIKHVVLEAACDGYIPPMIRMDLTDKNGYSTNMKLSMAKIVPSEGFMLYRMNFNGKWIQSWPTKQNVDSSNIVKITMNVNPPLDATVKPYNGEIKLRKLSFTTKKK